MSLRAALLFLIVLAAGSAVAQTAPLSVARAVIESVSPTARPDRAHARGRPGDGASRRQDGGHPHPACGARRLKPGAFIGVAALPGTDGQLKAMEVHVFPERCRNGRRSSSLRPRPGQHHDQRRGVRAGRRRRRRQPDRDLQRRPAGDRGRSEDADREVSRPAPGPISSLEPPSSPAAPRRATDQSTRCGSWSARTASFRRFERRLTDRHNGVDLPQKAHRVSAQLSCFLGRDA